MYGGGTVAPGVVPGVIPGPGWVRPSFVLSNVCSFFRVCVAFPPADRQLRLNTASRCDCVCGCLCPPVAQCQPHTAGDRMKDPRALGLF